MLVTAHSSSDFPFKAAVSESILHSLISLCVHVWVHTCHSMHVVRGQLLRVGSHLLCGFRDRTQDVSVEIPLSTEPSC